jgi:aspartyl-tRNA(Asn)/glutamyl-tRNA(Gln) amidotransferase subunit B
MRGKEEAHDYRYFPDPDLPPLEVDPKWLDDVPEVPQQVRIRLANDGLRSDQAAALAIEAERLALYDELVSRGRAAEVSAKWVLGGHIPEGVERGYAADVVELSLEGVINTHALKTLLGCDRDAGESAEQVVKRLGLEQLDDADLVRDEVRKIVDAHPDEVARHAAGDGKVIGFFMGQAMRALKGKGDPKQVREALQEALDGGD